jgi:solute carrier family 25 carnitine/acylcarnitine transporter 20/29
MSADGNESKDALLTLPQLIASGSAAGIANSLIATPVENIRIRLQVQKPGVQPPGYTYYNGPLDAFRQISGHHGLRGVFHGLIPTLAREIVGYGAYFGVYEFLVQKRMRSLETTDRTQVTSGWSMLFGAAGGFCFWLACYPLDVVKSKIQVDSMDPTKRTYKGMTDCFVKTFKAEGVKGFTRGLAACMARAAPANAATFGGSLASWTDCR